MGKIILGVWDCPYCKRKAISGAVRECPGCGSPLGENVKFDLLKNFKTIEEEEAKKINKNPNWLCSYCKSFNPDESTSCISCGNQRSEADINYFQHHNISANNIQKKSAYESKIMSENSESSIYSDIEDSDYNSEFESDIENNNYDTMDDFSEEGDTKITTKLKTIISGGYSKITNIINPKMLICFSAIILVIISIIALCIPKTETMKVKQISWEYSMDIERYQTVNESDWYLPSEARLQRTAQEIHHYDPVIDHYETKTRQVSEDVLVGYEDVVVGYRDLGNGYFEEMTEKKPKYETKYHTETYKEPVYRNEPVYQTKYYYEIDKWLYDRTVKSNGFDKNPYWPEVELKEKERVTTKCSKYFAIVVEEDGDTNKISVEYADWLEIEIGMEVIVKKWLWTRKIVFDDDE